MDIKSLLSVTLQTIKAHQSIFSILVLLQLLLFGSVGYITTANVQHIVEGTQGILGQLDQANFDPQKINDGQPFLNDITPIYQSYQIMKKYTLRWLWGLAAIAFTLYAASWIISHSLFTASEEGSSKKKNLKRISIIWTRFSILILAMGVILFLLFSIVIKASFFNDPDQEQLYDRIKIAAGIGLLFYYCFIVIAAHITARTYRAVIQQSFRTGIKKIHYSLPIAFFLNACIVGTAELIKLALERTTSFFLLLLATILLALVLVTARLLWIKTQHALIERA
ncbi:hypothetical protein HYT55_05440 [Candidatus Woesearchaeota archaeon]|nr:hypothetical protein [Candidatus Woesearchaeota archaeon]